MSFRRAAALCPDRQADLEDRPAILGVAGGQAPAVIRDDPRRDRQPEAHAVAYLDEDNVEELSRGDAPSARVDVVSTVTEPELSAIRTAVPPRVLGGPTPVFRADHLAAIKFLAARPQDLVDFDHLISLGVDIDKVRFLIAGVDEAQVAPMMSRVRKARATRGVREREGRFLDDAALQRAWAAAQRSSPLD